MNDCLCKSFTLKDSATSRNVQKRDEMSEYLTERSWVEILEQGMAAYLTWPKRNEHGHYGERFKGFSILMKCTRVFVFNDSTLQQLAPAPIFTDGVNVYIHEQVANECWQDSKDQELEAFRPVWHGVMRSIEWAALQGNTDKVSQSEQAWRYVEHVPFDVWVKKLQKAKSNSWLSRLGFNLKTTPQEMQSTVQARKDVVQWIMSQQADTPDLKTDAAEKKINKMPAWMNEADRIVRTRWDDCPWLWEEKKPMTYQRWTLQWIVAERLGQLIGDARNAIKSTGSEAKILKEGWGPAMGGWTQTLRAMITEGDWVSFGRSMLSFIQTCHSLETLTFDEKTDITGVAAQVLEEMAYKMAWVDLLSGSYEFWTLSRVLKQDVERFWKTNQSSAEPAEALAFYSLLPDSPPNIAFKREYITAYFNDVLEKVAEVTDEDTQDKMLRQGFALLIMMVRGLDSDDAIIMVEKWREWAEDRAEDWFDDDDDFESGAPKYRDQLEKMVNEIYKSRRWTPDERQKIEQILLD